MRILALAAALSLAACASANVEPRIEVREVRTAVPVACVPASLGPAPDYPVDLIAILAMPGPDRYQAVAALMLLYRARLDEVEPVLALCAKAGKTPAN